MIESVQERQRGAYDFGSYYDNLCALQDSGPVPAVKAHLHEGVLDVNGDRIRAGDWDPILSALSINRNLRFVGVRSYFQLKINENTSERRAAHLKAKIPVIRSKDMTLRLCRALRDNLLVTEALTCIELQGLPLREKDLSCLVKGLVKNRTLKHLSFEFCRIADSGVQIICRALKQCGNVNALNLTGCSISFNGMTAVADLIKHQAMSRHNEAWKESLRYRRPNLDCMSGLRRVTLNGNPLVDNEGAASLAEAVKDDMWVKAIDLQQCGIGNAGAKAFLNVLKLNGTLTVLDLRQNPLIDRDLLRAVTEQVLVNSDGKDSEFRWLRVEESKAAEPSQSNGRGRPSQSLRSAPIAKRPAFRPGGKVKHGVTPLPLPPHSLPRSVDDRVESEAEEAMSARGMPWRTAARASRYKGYPPDHVPGKTHLEEHSVATTNELSSARSARTEEDLESATTRTESVVSPLVREFEEAPPPGSSLKELRIQVMHLRRQLNEETRARRRAEEKMMNLMLEKQRLQKDLSKKSLTEAPSHLTNGAGLNDKLLRNIEQSFQQFHQFLDLLRDAGLGRVVTAAGMDELPRTVPSDGPRVGREEERMRVPIIHRDVTASGEGFEAALDPVEQSYLSAAQARTEADRLYLRLKEATSQNAGDIGHFMPSFGVLTRGNLDAMRREEEDGDGRERKEEDNRNGLEDFNHIRHAQVVEAETSALEVEDVKREEEEEEEEVEEEEEEEEQEVPEMKDRAGDSARQDSLDGSLSSAPRPRFLRSSSDKAPSEEYNSDFEASEEISGPNRTFPADF